MQIKLHNYKNLSRQCKTLAIPIFQWNSDRKINTYNTRPNKSLDCRKHCTFSSSEVLVGALNYGYKIIEKVPYSLSNNDFLFGLDVDVKNYAIVPHLLGNYNIKSKCVEFHTASSCLSLPIFSSHSTQSPTQFLKGKRMKLVSILWLDAGYRRLKVCDGGASFKPRKLCSTSKYM